MEVETHSAADPFSPWRALARQRLALGDDDGAERAYLNALQLCGEDFDILNDFGVLALRRGHGAAARLAHERSLRLEPRSPIAHVNLGNILLDQGAPEPARAHFLAALAAKPGFAPAHRGLARGYDAEGDPRAVAHWPLAGEGGLQHRPKRGIGPALPVLLIASARLGNTPFAPWLDDGLFDLKIVEVEHFPPGAALPPHAAMFNLISEADLCPDALRRAGELAALSAAPLINPPAAVAATGRLDNARRLGALPDVAAPRMRLMARARIETDLNAADFPLLLRPPGFHAGKFFLRVESLADLPAALAELPGETLIAMSILDARGADGYNRKYRAMSIGGRWLPLHLAISPDWKVHYFSAGMAARAEHREAERAFLDDMPGAVGARAMAALQAIGETVGLDFFGVDFTLRPDGGLYLFEANAAMIMLDPPPAPMWDYRRPALAAARAAARRLVVEAALRDGGRRIG